MKAVARDLVRRSRMKTNVLAICKCILLIYSLCGLPYLMAGEVKYTFDTGGRLTKADYGNEKTITYTYDTGGNIVSIVASTASGITQAEFQLGIQKGWNLVSCPVGVDLTSYFTDTTFVSIWKWDANNDTWAVRLPSDTKDKGASYAQAKGFAFLSSVNPGEGFWVNSNSSLNLTVQGSPGTDGLVVKKEWNLLGPKKNETLNIATLLGSNATKVISIWKWQSGIWAVYLPEQTDKGKAYAEQKGFSLLSEIKPGEGFWVNAKEGFEME